MTDPVVENASPEEPSTSSNHAKSVTENPHGYPPFDPHHAPTYTNNQLRYYQISGANVDKTQLKDQLQERKNALELVDWLIGLPLERRADRGFPNWYDFAVMGQKTEVTLLSVLMRVEKAGEQF